MLLKTIAGRYERFGALKAIQDVALRAVNRVVTVRILKGVRIESVRPEFMKCDEPYRGEFLSEAVLTEIVRGRPDYEMTTDFLREAFSRGDECFGFLDGRNLAAYGWYSKRPTEIDTPGMILHFDDRYIYMYKGFTHADYRGRRLHAIGMTRALDAYLAKGYKGFVAYVEWNNFGSLKSCYRMGYSDFGNIYFTRLFGRYVTHADRGSMKYGFYLEHAVTPTLQPFPQHPPTTL